MRQILITLIVVLCVAVGPTAASAGNENPLADAGLDQTVELGTTVVLDATGSRDPDGSIVAFEWTIETPRGHVITPAEATQPRTTFSATEPGLYRVTITVRDDDGASTRDTLYVTVNRTNKSVPTGRPTDSLSNNSSTDSQYSDNQTDGNNTIRDDNSFEYQGNESDIRGDDAGRITDRTSPPRTDVESPTSNEQSPTSTDDQSVEVVRYVAEDIDLDVTAGQNSVNNNKLSGASGSKTVDYAELDGLVNAGNSFIQGSKELIFGRERQTYSFTTTNRSEALYENSSKTDINGYEIDAFSDGPAVGLNKEYVDFRRISDKPVDNADVYKVHVVVQGEKGLVDYANDIGNMRGNDTAVIDNSIHSGIERITHDYSSKTNNDWFGENINIPKNSLKVAE
jgi:hypothetical protein